MRTLVWLICWALAFAIAFGLLTWTYGSAFLLTLLGLATAAAIGALLMTGKAKK